MSVIEYSLFFINHFWPVWYFFSGESRFRSQATVARLRDVLHNFPGRFQTILSVDLFRHTIHHHTFLAHRLYPLLAVPVRHHSAVCRRTKPDTFFKFTGVIVLSVNIDKEYLIIERVYLQNGLWMSIHQQISLIHFWGSNIGESVSLLMLLKLRHRINRTHFRLIHEKESTLTNTSSITFYVNHTIEAYWGWFR